ncbi:tetratricopeptide repeat protein [Candidatus Kryptobacter tengchongensis]|uniref:tetratricopeptide repeat protein n=1 Tax=Kryptobacter tengchongensis TaxID=1643429 RepID=UPI0007082C92|nr:tetratricopeptide repeat protein [Candidatus Kryptobacter tengchongensis]CUS79360.1 Tetratricopeptide repeat-containing protein [Candidatus Kryptobacter tengchongensis]
MRHFIITIVSIFLLACEVFSQSVTLKVREKTILRGERYLTVKFSVEGASENFTDVDVTKGAYYYFVCLPEGDWAIDEEFAKEFTSKVLIQQDGNVYYPEVYDILTIGGKVGLMMGFEKKFKIEKPFKINYPISEKVVSSGEMNIPENLWEGYSKSFKTYQDGVKLYSDRNYQRSADVLFSVVADDMAKKFSFYKDAREKCVKSLDNILIELVDKFNSIVSATMEPEDKLKMYDSLKIQFQDYVNAVLTPKLNVLADTLVFAMLSRANSYFEKIENEISAEKYRLDVKNISWLNTESGLNFKYRLIIDALAYAFTSESFWDNPDTTKFEFVLPDTLLANLKVFGVEKDYNIFQRVCISNMKNKGTLFDEKFLVNLLNNSSYLSQPYYEIFLAIDNYIRKNYSESKNYIIGALKRLTDYELIRRIEVLRSMIFVKQQNLSAEAVELYREGLRKLSSGDKTGGLDAFRRAILLEPRFPLTNFTIGEIYFQENDLYPAIIYFSKAVSLDSNFVLAYERLFDIYRIQGNWADARTVLETALSGGNDFWIIRILLAQAYNELKLYDKAIESLTKAISYNPLNYEQYVYLGVVYSNVGRFEDAERVLKKAAEINPDRKEAYQELKRVEELKKQKKQDEKLKEKKK